MTTDPRLADQVVEVLRLHDGRWSVGSGFVVRDGIVLTAAHVVGEGTLLVRFRGTDERPARLLALDEATDIALIEFEGAGASAVSFAVLRDDPALGTPNLEGCVAFGFPVFAEKVRTGNDKPVRELVRVDGYVPMGEGAVEGLATLRVPDAPRDAPIPAGPLAESAWQGISGSVVFAAGHAIGVISEHHAPAGMNGLTFVPFSRLDESWWARLGVPDSAALPRLPADLRLDASLPNAEVVRRFRGLVLNQPEFTRLSSPFGGLPAEFFQPRLLRPAGPPGSQTDDQPQPLPEVVLNVERLVIIGDAGLGKTTLLHEIARRMAEGDYPGIPIFVRLHDLARRGMGTDLLTFAITEHFGDGLRRSEVEQVIDVLRGRDDLVYLFDGLDEVPIGQLDDVLAKVRRSRRFVLTTRPMSRVDALQDSGATYRITELTDDGVTAFVRQWAVKEPRAAALGGRIAEDQVMAELARLPQFLVLLCWMWRSTSSAGFHSRVQILSGAVEEAMARATRISRLADGDEHVVPWDVRVALRALALEAVTTGDGNEVTFTRRRLLELLADAGGRDRAGLLLAFALRTGLVVPAGGSGEELQFLHSLFRTLLAGEALKNHRNPVAEVELLADRLAGRDVLVTAAALDPARMPVLILDRMAARQPDIFRMNWWLAALCMGGVADQAPIEHRLEVLADEVFAAACEWWSRDRFAVVVGCLHTDHVRGMLVRGLSDPVVSVRWASALALDHLREAEAMPYLMERLPDEQNDGVRCAVIAAVGRLRDSSAVPGLWEEFERRGDNDTLTNRAIGESLARLGADNDIRALISHTDEKRVRDLLIGAMAFLGQPARGEVFDALATHGITISSEHHVRQYIADLRDPTTTLERKHNAINGLSEPSDEEALDVLVQTATYGDDEDLREHAASVLLELSTDDFSWLVGHLVTELLSQRGDDRLMFAHAFLALWISSAQATMANDLTYSFSADTIAALVSDEDVWVRAAAVVLAALSGNARPEWLVELVDSPDDWIRCAVISVAGRTGAVEVVAPVVARLRVEEARMVRTACLYALVRLAPQAAAEEVMRSLDAEDPAERAAAAEALTALESVDFESLAARMPQEPNPTVRVALIRALQQDLTGRPVRDAVALQLSDEDSEVRAAALEAVSAARMTECERRVRELLFDPEERVAEAASECYPKIAGFDDFVTLVHEMVAAGLPDQVMDTVGQALVDRPEFADDLVRVIEATGGRALATRRGSAVRYPRRTHTYYVESGDREAGELLEVLKDPDPGERWLAVRDIRPFLVESGVLGALGLALLDPDEWVADAARMVLQNFSDEYTVNQLDSRSLELLGTDEVLSALADRMAADRSDANVIAWLLQQREHLPALLRMYTAGRTELRRVLWAIADRHQLRLFDDGTALLPSGETVPWPELATAAY